MRKLIYEATRASGRCTGESLLVGNRWRSPESQSMTRCSERCSVENIYGTVCLVSCNAIFPRRATVTQLYCSCANAVLSEAAAGRPGNQGRAAVLNYDSLVGLGAGGTGTTHREHRPGSSEYHGFLFYLDPLRPKCVISDGTSDGYERHMNS